MNELEIYRSYFLDLAINIKQLKLMYKIHNAKTLSQLILLGEELGMLYTVRRGPIRYPQDKLTVLGPSHLFETSSEYNCSFCSSYVGRRASGYSYLKYDYGGHLPSCSLHTLWKTLHDLQTRII